MRITLTNCIKNLNLSKRTYNALKRAGVGTVGELIERYSDLDNIHNLGIKSKYEVGICLYQYGLIDTKPQEPKKTPLTKRPEEMVLAYEKRAAMSFRLALEKLVRVNESFPEWVKRVKPQYMNLDTRKFEYVDEMIHNYPFFSTEEEAKTFAKENVRGVIDKAKKEYELGGIESRQNEWFIFRMLEYGDSRLQGTVIFEKHKIQK